MLALTRRDVRLTVTHDGRPVLAMPPATSLRTRLAALWGASIAERLVDVEDVSGAIHVTGLVERPGDVGTSGRRVYLAINGRSIRDNGIVRAAEAAYRSTIPSGTRPTVLLDLVLPADAVDVNVHPTKAEIRLRDRWSVERAVEQAVRRALGGTESAAILGRRAWPVAPLPERAPATPVDVEVLQHAPHAEPDTLFAAATALGSADAPSPSAPEDAAEEESDVPKLVQLHRTYIVFEREDGMVLIDQHSAHERVLYEKFMHSLECGDAPSQRLLFPITIHLGPSEGEAFDEHRDFFARIGFEIDGFGGHTLIVNAVPMPHPRFDAQRCLRDTLDALTGDRLAATAGRHERLAATFACKAAVKGGDPLSVDEMRALYRALAGTTLPAHDVHGRATIVQIPWDEVERRFGRR